MNLARIFVLVCIFGLSTIFVLMQLEKRCSGVHAVRDSMNMPRNLNDYVKDQMRAVILPKNFCVRRQRSLLLIIVMSRPTSYAARQAIRKTWGRESIDVSVYFLLGESNDDQETQDTLEIENLVHGDIIVEQFIDSYNNLTLKSASMLKLFNTFCSTSHKYLMKVDDDVFVNTHLVVEMLSNRTTKTNLIIGQLMNNTSPIRKIDSKWYVPHELYPEEYYPDYLCGASYIMSADAATKLYNCALTTPFFYLEDVYITGMCAKKMKLTLEHNPLFQCTYGGLSRDYCAYKKMYAVHHITGEFMRDLHKILPNYTCPETLWIILSIVVGNLSRKN